MRLDRIDFALLRALRKNARTPNKTLADIAGVAPSTALERIRRLRVERVIEGFHVEVNPAPVGIGLQALVDIRLAHHAQTAVHTFEHHLGSLREVLSWYHLAGATDYLVHVAVRNSDHLRDFILAAFTSRDEVEHIETHLIFSFHRNPDLPIYLEDEDDE